MNMSRQFITQLNQKYASADLDFMKALQVWGIDNLSPDEIKAQVEFDIDRMITSEEATEIKKFAEEQLKFFSEEMFNTSNPVKCDKLSPKNIKEEDRPKIMKFTQKKRDEMERVGHNLFREKTAGKYWTLKEKISDDGSKAMFLVAVEDDDDGREEKK